MAATKTSLTWEQFRAAGKEGQRWECVDGELKFMSPHMGGKHFTAATKICLAANEYAGQHPEWMSVHTDVAFAIGPGTWRCPDWALIRRERFGVDCLPEGPIPFAPDVAFEVISPGDKWFDIQEKRREYKAHGVVQVWVDTQGQQVEIISPKHGSRMFERAETVVIEELPGFELNPFPVLSQGE